MSFDEEIVKSSRLFFQASGRRLKLDITMAKAYRRQIKAAECINNLEE